MIATEQSGSEKKGLSAMVDYMGQGWGSAKSNIQHTIEHQQEEHKKSVAYKAQRAALKAQEAAISILLVEGYDNVLTPVQETFARKIDDSTEVNMLTLARVMYRGSNGPSIDAALPLLIVIAQLGVFAALGWLALFKETELQMSKGWCPNTADIYTRVIMFCISLVYVGAAGFRSSDARNRAIPLMTCLCPSWTGRALACHFARLC